MRRLLVVAFTIGGLRTNGRAMQTSLAGTWVATTDAPPGLAPAPSAILGTGFGASQSIRVAGA